ncbi:cell growth regulator with RING finger domain protein 1 isoform X1 [Astyanax mexicanus]|uniref:Cell growth regulator with RING finger domain protein 1 n=1 Tax=Astyanax mexicanus TaxID=7994 RepID=A0A8B9LKK1_ASTMX|nr:cell growth regulator with RING finger domain protein 1 isoform X1 [Astyanax mexicanus]
MAAEFLVKLYEYSPVFYISVISVCFIITAAAVLGWFGFDVPVILRSSDEAESFLPVPEKRMVQVTNPFSLEMGTTAGTLLDGVSLQSYCLEECVLSCYWGCGVQVLQAALQKHQHDTALSTPQLFQQALQLHYLHCQTFQLQKEERKECFTELPADLGVTDFGPLPRDRYPLVAVLTLANTEHRETYNIVSSVTVLHIPDDKYRLSARILFQYLLTAQGNMFDLKPLFMSADSSMQPGSSTVEDPPQSTRAEEEREEPEEEEEEETGAPGRDCVVCQNAPVNRVLLPCRHACVCDGCVARFQHCPICRAFVVESFALANQTQAGDVAEE